MVYVQNQTRKVVGQTRPKADVQNQIEAIEKEIRETPYHKATERHIGLLRARLAKLKDKQIDSQTKKGGGGGGGYAVKKQGDATIVLIGPPSAGKSTLINKLTNAESKVAPYAFTTVSVIPGMMQYKNAYIQILDVPGLIEGAEEGKGRGREVLSVARACDLLVIITDIDRLGAFEAITTALERNGIRINKTKPRVQIEKKLSGTLNINSNIHLDLGRETIRDVAMEMGIKSGDITIKENLTMEKLIDAFSKSRVYIPAIYVLNKIDLKDDIQSTNENLKIIKMSAEKETGLAEFKENVWEKLGFVSIYLVKADEEPNFENPIIMKSNQKLSDVVEKLGTDFSQNKKGAKIWGPTAKFPGQEVSLSMPVAEGMQVRFI